MKVLMIIAMGLLLFGSGAAAGYWAIPQVVTAITARQQAPASPPPGSLALPDTAASATAASDANTNTNDTNQSSGPSQPPFQTILLTGRGQQATRVFSLPAGGYRVTMTHDGQSNFMVILDDSQGKSLGTLANQVGKTNVSQVINAGGGSYVCNVGADGNWTIKIEAL